MIRASHQQIIHYNVTYQQDMIKNPAIKVYAISISSSYISYLVFEATYGQHQSILL